MTVTKQGLGTETTCFITENHQSKDKTSATRAGKKVEGFKIYGRKGIWVPLKGSITLFPTQDVFSSPSPMFQLQSVVIS